MILERVLALYETEPDLLKRRKQPSGNPTASAVGGCLAAMQMCRFPALTHPEMRPIRSAWVFEDGDLHAEAVKTKIVRAFPGITGLSEELFYFPVPVTTEQAAALETKILDKTLWGMIRNGFVPPRVERAPDGSLGRVRLIDREQRYRMGHVLDSAAGILWSPLYVDHVMNHPEHGLVVMEFKSMSRFGFRKALLGEMGDRERMQLAMIGTATGLDTCWVLKAKDTSHMLEIVFLRGQEKTRVILTKTNGQQETFLVPRPGLAVDQEGRPVDLQENETWDVGEVWTPWDPALLEQARQRVLDVLLFEPSADPEARDKSWMREYGPDYQCPTCDGTGTQTNRKGGNEPLKKPKPCDGCGQTGQLEEATLPAFPCGYSVHPDTPILLADHSWVPASKVHVGDRVIGVDEIPAGRFHRVKIGQVSAVRSRPAKTIRLVTAEGAVVCAPEHPFLVRQPSWRINQWRRAGNIPIGWSLAYLTAPVTTDLEDERYMGGYVRGLVDGEGAISHRLTGRPTVRVAMADMEALERLSLYLQYFGLHTSLTPFSAYTNRPMFKVVFGGRHHDPHGMTGKLLSWPITSREAACGYLAAMFDGEGSLERGIGKGNLRIHQIMDGPVSIMIKQAVALTGLPMQAEGWRHGRGVGAYRLKSPNLTGALAAFMCATRPAILRKACLEERPIRNVWTPVLSVEPVSDSEETIDLTVFGTATFIAGGYVSHNCPVVKTCWASAKVRLEIGTKPEYIIGRADYEASGLTFTPRGADPIPSTVGTENSQ